MTRDRLLWIVLAVIGGGLILLVLNNSSGETLGITNDAFGQTLYLGVWGTVIAAGILGSGMRLALVARSLALWMLLALCLIAGYQYRYELQDFASRVTAGLVPGSPISVSDSDGKHVVMLDKLSNGHFGARARINGAAIDMLVDTGATSTVLTAADAKRAGFDTEALSYTIPVATANGAARAARVTADEITIGDITRHRVPMLVAENHALGQSLLGMNFIGTLSGFDVRGDRMVLKD
jgi:aspartyl protease family protein